jgi:L-asparaginase
VTASIAILTTGGTIATTNDPSTGRSSPTLGVRVADLADVEGIKVVSEEVSSVPSWRLDPLEMARIARRAVTYAERAGVDGVVVTHGTTTLEYTAFLVHMLLGSDTPVVLTGAMRRADDREPDGPANLRDAALTAAGFEARGLGALVVFAGRILGGGRVWKANRSDRDAFVDLSGRDVGSIRAGTITIDDRPARLHPFDGELEPRVRLVKLTPGTDGADIESAAVRGARGLVVEALPGSGGVPPGALEALSSVADRMPVVVASRAPFGRQPDAPTGGTGEPLAGLPLLSARSLSAEQAWLLLMLVLGESPDFDPAARERFNTVAAGASAPGAR